MHIENLQKIYQRILDDLGVHSTVSVAQEEIAIKVQIDCPDDASLLIGYHADVLLSLQKIFTVIASKHVGSKVNLVVDIGDYRDRQKARLEEIAESACQRAITEKRSVILRSFSSYERRILHEFISTKHPELQSYSEGEKNERVMFIKSKEE